MRAKPFVGARSGAAVEARVTYAVDHPELAGDLNLASGERVERELRGRHNRSFFLRTLSYRAKGRVDGVVEGLDGSPDILREEIEALPDLGRELSNLQLTVEEDRSPPATPRCSAPAYYGLAVYNGTVYWSNYYTSTIERCPAGASCVGDGGTSSPVAQSQGGAFAVAADSTGVYWTTFSSNTVMKCALNTDCGTAGATVIATGQTNPSSIAVDGTFVYWTNDNGKVMKCAKTGGCGTTPMLVADSQFTPRGVAVDSTSVCWANTIIDGGVMKQKPR